ncbi:SGNH/GDSL hydrolase family protein [Vallicoccus soli]|nr:SGNH/GDSL hydrolase family protein [Vallicoccus soli]
MADHERDRADRRRAAPGAVLRRALTAGLLAALVAGCGGSGSPGPDAAPNPPAPAATTPAPTTPAPAPTTPTTPAPAPSTPAAPAPPPGAPLHVALGDSVAAGVGAAEGAGYVDLLHERLARCAPGAAPGCGTRLVDLSRLGATTGSVLRGQLPRLQDLAAREPVGLVTLDVGGNDVFGPVVGTCAQGDAAACTRRVAEVLDGVAADYDELLDGVRAAVGGDAALAVMTYYDPVPSCALAALAPLSERVLRGADGEPGLDDVIARAAREHGALVVDAAAVIGPDDLVGGADCLHPDGSGHAAIAGAFADALGAPG